MINYNKPNLGDLLADVILYTSGRYLKIMNLNVCNLKLLIVTAVSSNKKLSKVVFFILCWILLIHKLLQWLHHNIMRREKEDWNRKPFPFGVHHHPVLHTLVKFITPDLQKSGLCQQMIQNH